MTSLVFFLLKQPKKLMVVLALVSLFNTLIVSAPFAEEKGEVRVGALLALTGDIASRGRALREGMELAVSEKRSFKPTVKFIVDDIESLQAQAAAKAAQRQANVSKVDVALTMWIEEALPTGPILAAKDIPLLVAWDSNAQLLSSGKNVFSNGYSTELSAMKAAEYVFNHMKISSIAIVGHEDPWSQVSRNSFRQRFEELGGIVLSEYANPLSSEDFRTILTRIKNSEAKGIYAPLVPPTIAAFFRQRAELGVDLPVMSGDSTDKTVIKLSGSGIEGMFFTDVENTTGAKLKSMYREKYGREPEEVHYVDLGYTAMNKVYDAIRISTAKKVSLQAAFEEMYGPTRSANRVEKIYQVKKGEVVRVTE